LSITFTVSSVTSCNYADFRSAKVELLIQMEQGAYSKVEQTWCTLYNTNHNAKVWMGYKEARQRAELYRNPGPPGE
ncbi:hypothetical protein, partial [Paenibacillus sp. SAFN-117]|uniref:hypothetical protein n=1 Tax=Paenibacillus sp. SAFN-117 TaxID=3436860 RepID=UPI003F7EBEA0